MLGIHVKHITRWCPPKGSPQGNGVNVLILCATKDQKALGVIVGSTHWDKKTCENSRMGQGSNSICLA